MISGLVEAYFGYVAVAFLVPLGYIAAWNTVKAVLKW